MGGAYCPICSFLGSMSIVSFILMIHIDCFTFSWLFVGYSRSTCSHIVHMIQEDQFFGSFNSDIELIHEICWADDNLRSTVVYEYVEPDGQQFRNLSQALNYFILVVESKLLFDEQQLGRNDISRRFSYAKGYSAFCGKPGQVFYIVLKDSFTLHTFEFNTPVSIYLRRGTRKFWELICWVFLARTKNYTRFFSFLNFRSWLSCCVDDIFCRHPWFYLLNISSKLHFAFRVTTLLHFQVLLLGNSFSWCFAAFLSLGISDETSTPKCQNSLTMRFYLIFRPGSSRSWTRTFVKAFDFARIVRLDIGLFWSYGFREFVVLVFL